MRLELPDFYIPWRKSMAISGQEFRLLGLAAMGYSDSRIGVELGMTRPAIAELWHKIYSKFGATDRSGAVSNYADRLRSGQIKPLPSLVQNLDKIDLNVVRSGVDQLPQRQLLMAISDASASYIEGRQNVRHVYSKMLDDFMSLTESHYGMIAEVRQESGNSVIGEFALMCSGWDPTSQAKFENGKGHKLAFEDLDPLFSEPLVSRERFIRNSVERVGQQTQYSEGHPNVTSFLGIPVYSGLELVAIVGLANRRKPYTAELSDFLKPLVVALANLTVAWRLETARRKMEREMDAAACIMRTMVDRAPSAVLYETADRHLDFINDRFASLFGIEASPSQVVGIDAELVVKHSQKLFADPEQFVRRVENLIEGQESCYGEEIEMADGRKFLRDFVVVRSGQFTCGYLWHYRSAVYVHD